MQSLRDPEVTISDRMHRTKLRDGGDEPLSATQPKATYPGGATGIQTQHSSESASFLSASAPVSLSPLVDQRSSKLTGF